MMTSKEHSKKLIIVSNRLPVTFSLKKGVVSAGPSAGGLVSSLKSYIDKISNGENSTKVVWIGSCDVPEKNFTASFKNDRTTHDNYTMAPVFLTAEIKDKFYNGFCNDTIWPLFHYFPSYAKFKEEFYAQYQTANQLFAQKIMQVYEPGDLIWIHDYHLMLLPGIIRQMAPDASIGFFLHIPFPSFELFRLLPSLWRKDILNGLLGADLIGFHTNDYVQHFLKSVRNILGYDNNMRLIMTPERSMMADVFPVSIDFEKFHGSVNNSKTFVERNVIRKNLHELRTVVSVDRLDYTKGIVNRLESFELFLEKYPAYIGSVSYLLLVVPSRDIITRYRENKREIEETVSRINGKFGSIGHTPVVYQYRSLEFDELTGLYLAADVAFITPVRDGMNLVAKEFIATWNNGRGVLILSETAGAAAELGEAVLVNPTDRNEMADALYTALNMPLPEQQAKNKVMQRRLKDYDVTKWAEDFISSLLQAKTKQETYSMREIGSTVESSIHEKLMASQKRLFLFDYDGTLSSFTKIPEQAVPDQELLQLLKSLAQAPGNTVVVVSGRPRETLEDWFGHLPVDLVAEHGAFVRMQGGEWEKTVQGNAEWKNNVFLVLERFTDRCPGSFIEQKELSVSWHYRNADPDLGFLRSRELLDTLNELSAHQDFQVMEGNKIIEVRSRGMDKGSAVGNWLNSQQYDFVLAIGDDKTDEDMFKVIPDDGFSIKVGMTPSAARYNLRNQKSVRPFLTRLGLLFVNSSMKVYENR